MDTLGRVSLFCCWFCQTIHKMFSYKQLASNRPHPTKLQPFWTPNTLRVDWTRSCTSLARVLDAVFMTLILDIFSIYITCFHELLRNKSRFVSSRWYYNNITLRSSAHLTSLVMMTESLIINSQIICAGDRARI